MQEEPGGWSAEIAGLGWLRMGREPHPPPEGLQNQGSQAAPTPNLILVQGFLPSQCHHST